LAEKSLAHAAVGCVSAGINGGSCKSGAISGGFAAAAGGLMPKGWDILRHARWSVVQPHD